MNYELKNPTHSFAFIVIFIAFLFTTCNVFAQQTQFKLYLVGDAGENELAGETLDSLKSKILNNPNSAIIFMGDNCYKNTFLGLIEGFKGFDSSKITQRKLRSELDILNGYRGSVFFVPGNHDWWNITKYEKGKRKLKMEESFIEENLKKNPTIANPDATFLPKNGGPGPASVELNKKKVRVVFIDTYWLILLGFKKNPAENLAIAKIFYHNLDSILRAASKLHQNIVVVAHHPINSTGPVGKKKLKHPFLLSRLKQSLQTFPSYDTMCRKINAILQKYPGIYYASGHIHALQFHTANGVNYIISGAGSKTHHLNVDYVKCGKDSTIVDTCLPSEVETANRNKVIRCKECNYCNDGYCELWNEKGFFEMDFYNGYTPEVIIYHNNGRESTKIEMRYKR